MDTDRPHRSNSSNNNSGNSSTSELFICFTSRLSSSSMKISPKSILSPGRAREPSQISLSTSLSRRLRSNGSMKGGQASPMFPTNGKKKGCAFENPEPSSPKVTCIGQVRVKTKKQGKKLRTRSRSQRRGGEVSFRRVDQSNNNNGSSSSNLETPSSHQDFSNQFLNSQQQQQECLPHRNQRWVHLPLTICEALRAFGAEFNCFLPCRSSCMASEKEKEEKTAGSSSGSSCGAVFARWLVAVQEGEGKGREIELLVGEEEEEELEERRRSYRRHVFEEIEFKEEKCEEGNGNVEEEEGTVSICIPPKNALLLMRCRSDPVRMAALTNKFWEAPVPNNEVKEEVEDEDADADGGNEQEEEQGNAEDGQTKVEQEMKHREDIVCETIGEHEIHETQATTMVVLEQWNIEDNSQERITDIVGTEEEEGNLVKEEEQTEQKTLMGSSTYPTQQEETEDPHNFKNQENEKNIMLQVQENEDKEEHAIRPQGAEDEQEPQQQEQEEKENSNDSDIKESPLPISALLEQESEAAVNDELQEPKATELANQESSKEGQEAAEAEEAVTHQRSEHGEPRNQEGETGLKSNERENSQPLLPDCLLLMMCEPKLSMEVSKETWVCSTDFVRWLPDHSRPPVKKRDGRDEPKKRISIDINPPPSSLQQPPRSSCSYPAKPPPRAAGAESMSTAIEKKLVGTKGYEPFVLTRCKSEPMRSAGKLAADACFCKNRKLEPHRPATLGVGAAGVGC